MPLIKSKTDLAMPLKLPQVRVLAALAGGGAHTQHRLKDRCGFSAVSGTLTRIINGLREGSSSGAAHPGLLALGFVERHELDINGLAEACFAITPAGEEALAAWVAANGEPPAMRSAESSTNKRYKERIGTNAAGSEEQE